MADMNETEKRDESEAHYSRICTEACGGACCDPWWGIISYPLVKPDGTANMAGWRKVLLGSIKEREERITGAYVTKEARPRRLFGRPERYNVSVQKIRAEGGALVVTLLAMYAFRCRYLGPHKECTIHPSLTPGADNGTGRDIRPDQCGFLGVPGAGPGEKGYCRIIYEAGTEADSTNEEAITRAIKKERGVSAGHLQRGAATPEEAADRVMGEITEYLRLHPDLKGGLNKGAPGTGGAKTGRNEPCTCGSGKKFKKCCGR
jgi:hypothetical protein